MAVYRLREHAHEKYSHYKWIAPLVLISFAAIVIVSNRWESGWRSSYPHALDVPGILSSVAIVGVIFSAFFLLAAHYAPNRILNLEIRVTSEGVLSRGGVRDEVFLPRDDITGYEEHANGLVLRTVDPTQKIQIPSNIEDYAECQREIAALGVPKIHEPKRDWLKTLIIPVSLLLVALSYILVKVRGPLVRVYMDVIFGIFALYVVLTNGSAKRKPWRILLIAFFTVSAILLALSQIHHN
ncbi:MAG TPA: hypothetical protein VIY69_18235 [Candidatus Acidoferrales bacterium]